MSEFAKRLKQLRLKSNYTQDELANLLKTTRSRVSMYEQGKREPDFEMQESIADLFNVDLDYLLGRTEEDSQVTRAALALYYKYLAVDKKTRNIIDQLLESND